LKSNFSELTTIAKTEQKISLRSILANWNEYSMLTFILNLDAIISWRVNCLIICQDKCAGVPLSWPERILSLVGDNYIKQSKRLNLSPDYISLNQIDVKKSIKCFKLHHINAFTVFWPQNATPINTYYSLPNPLTDN
jgi:hypothetical protein